MSRRRSRRVDALAERVADGFLEDDMARAKARALSPSHRWFLDSVLLDEKRAQKMDWWCNRQIQKLYEDLQARAALAPYYYGDDMPSHTHRCLSCGRELEVPQQRQRGRRREYCDCACRQQAYRNRKRATHPPSSKA